MEVQREMHLFLSWLSKDWKMDPCSDTLSFHVPVVHKWLYHSCCNSLILTWSDMIWQKSKNKTLCRCSDNQKDKLGRNKPTGGKQAQKVSHQDPAKWIKVGKKRKKGKKIITLCKVWLPFLEKFELCCCFWLSVQIMLTKDFQCVYFFGMYMYICVYMKHNFIITLNL